MQCWTVACVFVGVAAACSPPGPRNTSTLPAARTQLGVHADVIDDEIEGVMAEAHTPGMGVAIVRDGKIEKLRGYGRASLDWPTPVDEHTRFQIASTTKIFTATLLMQLVQEGVIGLDQPVSAYLHDAPEAWSGMTVRQLAAHAGGLPDDLDPTLSTMAAAYAALRARPLLFAPGSKSKYGVGDFVVLVHIVETVTGHRYEDLLRARIFMPLGFTCTSFEHASQDGPVRLADPIASRATVYRWVDGHQRIAWYLYPEYTYPSGGAFSCLDDLAKWAIAMDRETLLTADSQRAAGAAFRSGDQASGFGVVFAVSSLRGRAELGHSGGPALADVVRIPSEKLTVIVLANQQRMFPNLARRIAGQLLPPAELAAIADTDPTLTARHERLVEQMRTGDLDERVIAERVRAELVPVSRQWAPLQTAGLPRLERFVLADEHTTSAGRVRAYLAIYGATMLRWTFTLDADSQVVDIADPVVE